MANDIVRAGDVEIMMLSDGMLEILVAAGHFQAPGFGGIVKLDGRRCWRGL
jgi:hypothetical protein